MKPKDAPTTWHELVDLTETVDLKKEAEALIRRQGQEVDRRKCGVKRGVLEEETDLVLGLLRI